MSLPKISIIIPVLNREKTIGNCIDSLTAQEYPAPFEIIAVDNGSRDSTPEILKKFADAGKIKFIRELKILNAYGARNAGARIATGEVFAFTDSDCIARKDWLLQLVSGWKEKNTGIFIGDVLIQKPANVIESYYSNEMLSFRGKKIEGFIGMRTCNCAITRECFESLGGFRENVSSGGDSDFLERALRSGRFSFRLQLDAVVYHKNPSSLYDIFKRNLRLGTNIPHLKNNDYRKSDYVPLSSHFRKLGTTILALGARCLFYFPVRWGLKYRGKKINNADLFIAEAAIRFTEQSAQLIGRMLQFKIFR